MHKNKKTSSKENVFSQSCFFFILLPSGIATGIFLIWASIAIFQSRWWYGLNTVLTVDGIFLVCLAVVAYMTWRIARKKYRSLKVQQEHARIERLMEQEAVEEDSLEDIEENHLSQNKQNSV